MLITAIITLGCVITWAVTARALFRRWVRNSQLHRWEAAVLAIAGGLFLPAVAFVAFVVRNPPMSQRELEAQTRALEAENARLQREQADPTTHDCRDNDETDWNGGKYAYEYDAFDQIVRPRT